MFKKIISTKFLLFVFLGFIAVVIVGNITTYLLFSPAPYEIGDKYKILKDNKTLSFRGEIDGDEFKRFNSFFNKNINNFVVNSVGGDIKQAILISEVLSKNGVKVIIDGICGSSCANYFFVAGKQRKISKNSFLLYHGGLSDGTFTMIDNGTSFPMPSSFIGLIYYWAMYENAKEYEGFKDREKQLYKNRGIDLAIIKTSREKIQGGKYHFWSPSKKALNDYGFDTKDFWYSSNEQEKSKAIKYVCGNKIDYSNGRDTKKCEERFFHKFLIE